MHSKPPGDPFSASQKHTIKAPKRRDQAGAKSSKPHDEKCCVFVHVGHRSVLERPEIDEKKITIDIAYLLLLLLLRYCYCYCLGIATAIA